MRSPLVAAGLAALALACSTTYDGAKRAGGAIDDPGSGNGNGAGADKADGQVGSACGTCEADLICTTQAPGGYCTKSCTGPADCPFRTRCYSFKGTTDQYCLKSCFNGSNCRTGYVCAGELGDQVCVPPSATGG